MLIKGYLDHLIRQIVHFLLILLGLMMSMNLVHIKRIFIFHCNHMKKC